MTASIGTLMEQARQARRDNRLADAHRDLTTAVELSRSVGTPSNLIRVLKALGQIERDLGHTTAARSLYDEATALCRDHGDATALAHTVRHLGDVHREAGDLQAAEPCYREAIALYRADGRTHTVDLANALRPLAILHEEIGGVEEAQALWMEARDLYAAAGVRAGVNECTDRLERNPPPG